MTAHPTPRRSTRARLATGALALLLLGGTAACGASGGEDAGDEPTTTEAEATTTAPEDDEATTTAPDDDDTTTTEPDDEGDGDEGDGGGGEAEDYVDALVSSLEGNDDQNAPTEDQARCLAEAWLDELGLEELQDAGVEPEEFRALDAEDYVDALVSSLEGNDDQNAPTEDQARCLAEAWLDELGLEELQDAGVEPEEFRALDAEALEGLDPDDDTASALFDAYLDCDFDLVAQLTSFYTGGEELTDDEAACAEDLLTEDALRESYIADFFDRDLEGDVLEELEGCFPDREDPAEDGGATAETVPAPED